MSVSREEFDNLKHPVDRIERTLGASIEIMSAELVGLRTYLDEQFAHVDERLDSHDDRFDSLESKLDRYTEQVQAAIAVGSDAAARNERFARVIAEHFGIDLSEN